MGKMNDIRDDNPDATFGYIAERLSDYGLAYLHIVNRRWSRCRTGRSGSAGARNDQADPEEVQGT